MSSITTRAQTQIYKAVSNIKVGEHLHKKDANNLKALTKELTGISNPPIGGIARGDAKTLLGQVASMREGLTPANSKMYAEKSSILDKLIVQLHSIANPKESPKSTISSTDMQKMNEARENGHKQDNQFSSRGIGLMNNTTSRRQDLM